MLHVTTVKLGLVEVDTNHDDRIVTHRWPDGLTLHASITYEWPGVVRHDDLTLAYKLGYRAPYQQGDVWPMILDHEHAHHYLGVWDGHPWSPELRHVAEHPDQATWTDEEAAWVDAAERAVLAYQLALPKPARPWSS